MFSQLSQGGECSLVLTESKRELNRSSGLPCLKIRVRDSSFSLIWN
jgi:hypothetical protein